MIQSNPGSVLLTGATGYLGGVLAAGLLADPRTRLVLPVRSRHSRDSILKQIAGEISAGDEIDPHWADRVCVLPLPPTEQIPALAPALRREGVDRIIHCAGCVDYFHTKNLDEGNIALTKAFVELGQELRARRFAFISTAFSSGYSRSPIAESLHAAAGEDPTEYTRTKRRAEEIVAGSGMPFLIVRPSVVIGDSRDGHYRGKRYGIYQLWAAAEKILCTEYIPEIYAIAPPNPLPLLHQDAFQSGFLAAWREMPANRVVNLVSRSDGLPTVRDLWDSFLMACNRPRVVHYFHRLADVPLEKLDRRQQMWVELTGVNLDISSHPWQFAHGTLDDLRRGGLQFADVTHDSIAVCQDRFIADSPRVQQFMKRFAADRSVTPQMVEHF